MERGNMQTKIVLLFVLFVVGLSSALCHAAEDAVVQQGIAQYKAENYEEALELFLKARAAKSTSQLLSYYLGLTYKNIEKHQLAKEQFLAALNQTPPVQDAYTELIDTLYSLDDLIAARQWLNKAEQSGVRPALISYLDGLVLMKEGRYREAVAAFNKAKGLDRSLGQSADLQIAIAQIKMRRFDDAKRSLQAIIAMDPASDIASFAQEYDRALAKTIEASKKWQITGGLAYQYDDNVLLKPATDIGIPFPRESDSSIVATLSLVTPTYISGSWSINGRYNLYSNTHFTLNSHDIISNTVSFVPSYSFGKGALSFPLTYSHIFLDKSKYMSLLSFRPMTQFILSPGHILQASAGYSKQDMLQPSFDPVINNRDADIYTASAGYIHPFNKNKNVFNMIYEFSRQNTVGRDWKNKGHRISAGLLLPFFRDDLNLILSGDALIQDYDNINTAGSMFQINKKRADRLYSGSANLRWTINKTASMNLQFSHTTADSNIPIYDYKRNIITAGMELKF